MPFQLDRLGLSESCLDGLKARIVSRLDNLNTVLALAPDLTLGPTIDASFVRIGDPEVVPSSGESTPMWISLVGGGKPDGKDMKIAISANGPQFRSTVWHNIYVYLHPETFPDADPVTQAELRERLRARVQDWMVGDVFNNPEGFEITLASRQYAVAPNFDKLTRSYITDVSKGFVMKSYGESVWVFMAHFMHEGLLLGGY